MTIDTSGKWWIGDQPEDIQYYLEALTEESYPIDDFRLAQCTCGCKTFQLEADEDGGTARRTCGLCEKQHFVCDSEEFWEEDATNKWNCVECGSVLANVGVGFALYDDGAAVQWLYIGVRCAQCGVLGCFADWKIGYAPSLQLFDRV